MGVGSAGVQFHASVCIRSNCGNLTFPVLGMVKRPFSKALTTEGGEEGLSHGVMSGFQEMSAFPVIDAVRSRVREMGTIGPTLWESEF